MQFCFFPTKDIFWRKAWEEKKIANQVVKMHCWVWRKWVKEVQSYNLATCKWDHASFSCNTFEIWEDIHQLYYKIWNIKYELYKTENIWWSCLFWSFYLKHSASLDAPREQSIWVITVVADRTRRTEGLHQVSTLTSWTGGRGLRVNQRKFAHLWPPS